MPPVLSHRSGPLGEGLGRLVRGLIALGALAVLVAGLPWALVGYVGWPLPHHVPTWPELQGVLLTPMGTQMLLDILTCICWVAWFAFVIDVARCTVDAARGLTLPRPRATRPLQGLAAALVGAVVLSVLSSRTGSPPASTTVIAQVDRSALVVTAPQHPAPVPPPADITPTTMPAPPGMVTVVVTVQGPHDGIYDSLWRIAQRLWGDGDRWPELFAQNRGVIQRDGHALTTPGYLRPGWQFTAFIPAPPATEHNGQSPHRITPPASPARAVPSPPATAVPAPATELAHTPAQAPPGTTQPDGGHARPTTGIFLVAFASVHTWSTTVARPAGAEYPNRRRKTLSTSAPFGGRPGMAMVPPKSTATQPTVAFTSRPSSRSTG